MKALLVCVIAFIVFVGGYWKGSYDKGVETALEVAAANDDARQKETQLATVATTYANVLRKNESNAQKKISDLRTAVVSGERKLFIPVTTETPNCSVQASTDASTTSGSDTGETRAELDRKIADSLIALTAEGDTAIRKLNTCISLYNELTQKENK
jgi:DICT domain-containing protein